MSPTKVRACRTLNEMNPEQDNLDSLIRQAIEKEPFLSFSRVGDRPIQLIQLLNAFEQQGSDKPSNNSNGNNFELKESSDNIFNVVNSFSSELNGIKDSVHSKGCMSNAKGTKCTSSQIPSRKVPEAVVAFAQAAAKATGEPEKSDLTGWPMLSPSKAQLQTCDKCSNEFCSFINYRRHRRIHRRSLNVDKDSIKNRDLLGTFWDKLSEDEAKELVSLNNVAMEVTGSSVIKALSTWFRRPGMLSSLPQVYTKAGSTLLDIVQASPSVFPISSQVLFSVLDEASEKTFLCAGTALSLQKYIFDVEAVKKALEIKNIVACTSFLIEIALVKAWLVDKDAEALRCQKLLVDEEEADQRRQAQILEKRRLKKLRQKEQKMKESNEGKVDSPPDCTGSAGTSSPRASSEDCNSEPSPNQEHQFFDSAETSTAEDDTNTEKRGFHYKQTGNWYFDQCGKGPEFPSYPEEAEQQKMYRIQRATGLMQPSHSRYFNSWQHQTNSPHGFQAGYSSSPKPRDSKAISRANGRKVWTIKSKPGDEDKEKCDRDMANGEVLIGSINVSLGPGELHRPSSTILETQNENRPVQPDSSLSSPNRTTTTKLWRPVSCHGNGNDCDNVKGENVRATNASEHDLPLQSCLSCGVTVPVLERCPGAMTFSSEIAKAFLAQRWKEAIAREEVVVIYSSEPEASGSPDAAESNLANSLPETPDPDGLHILGRVENQLAGVGASDTCCRSTGSRPSEVRPKAKKNSALKYVPKPKNAREW